MAEISMDILNWAHIGHNYILYLPEITDIPIFER